LAGEPPFAGPSAQTIIAKSLTAPRPHVGRIRAGVSEGLDEIVYRALALEPAGRYPDMAAMRSALRVAAAAPGPGVRRRYLLAGALAALAVGAGLFLTNRAPSRTVAPAAQMLAVLPFHTSGPGVEFLSEGMMDLLATNLRGVAGINTVDPRAVLREWGSTRGGDDLKRALAVGRDLDAGSVVLGSAVSTGGKVRVAADLYAIDGHRLGRAQVDGPADSVLAVVDRLSLALLRDVWRSKEPLPNLRLASLTTDSIDALRSYLEGERYYRRTEWDSALSAYTRAVETDSTFALAHLRRAQAFGWIGGYGNKDAHEAVAAGMRFAKRLPPRDRRLMAAYQLFDRGKPASIDTLRAFVADYPQDVEGWFLLGEAMFHTKSFRPSAADSIVAVFDSVLRKDSTLFPALIHPMELGVIYQDSARFARYFPEYSRTAPAAKVSAIRTTAKLLWGPPPTDKEIGTAWNEQGSWLIQAANSAYYWEKATSDSIASRYTRVQDVVPRTPGFLAGAFEVRAQAFAGLGRWRDAKVLVDSLARLDRGEALGVQGWAVALGLAPGVSPAFMDSAVAALPAGPEADLAKAMVNLVRGQVSEGRRRLARALADSARLTSYDRGMIVAADGWGAVIEGDTTGGLARLRSGLDQAAAPGMAAETAFLRLQLALALAARKETREEGITYFRYGFDNQPLYLPLLQLALGKTYEAAGQRDSAAAAYSRFLRLWDKADPDLQGRVKEAKEALQEVTRERPGAK
ncbi:MAG TPA: hypothetical protein VGP44_10045, partial [Gemmatimonadales bacterium]|nr:hypothetical protein [Gemmatimonadales bacterium]